MVLLERDNRDITKHSTIRSGIRKRHVFVWALNAAKLENQEQNFNTFDTYNIANAPTFTMAQLELSNGVFCPTEQMNPTNEVSKSYRQLIRYNKLFNDLLTGSQLTIDNFGNVYGLLYFDLRNQQTELKSATTKLSFRYTLNGAPNADYLLYCLILHEEEIEVFVQSGKALLRA